MALIWETVDKGGFLKPRTQRVKVPGGWFIAVSFGHIHVFFYSDPEHVWDGSSLP